MSLIESFGLPGTYEGWSTDPSGEGFLRLRLDAGEPDSLDIISGDLFTPAEPRVPGGTQLRGGYGVHLLSFRSTHLEVESTGESREGLLVAPINVFDPVSPRHGLVEVDLTGSELRVEVTWFHLIENVRTEFLSRTFNVEKTSELFRHVEVRISHVEGVPRPQEWLRQSVKDEFRSAGIDLVRMPERQLSISAAGEDRLWTPEELHAAMEETIELDPDPNWKIELIIANRYIDRNALGIMFDWFDPPRQGVAVFHERLVELYGDLEAPEFRDQLLFAAMHELGHAFNLPHAFDRYPGQPERLSKPGALTWMNYPEFYPYGYARRDEPEAAERRFWRGFRHDFDSDEIEYLRHSHPIAVMPGGRPFGWDARRRERPFMVPTQANSLELVLWVPPVVEFMEAVEGDVRLRNVGVDPQEVLDSLHPGSGQLQLLVKRPGADLPMVNGGDLLLCARRNTGLLNADQRRYQEVSPSFDGLGWMIDEPGKYQIQAINTTRDGIEIASRIETVEVLPANNHVAEVSAGDYFDSDAARFLIVEGSRLESLRSARERLRSMEERLDGSAVARQLRRTRLVMESRPVRVGAQATNRSDGSARELAGLLIGPDGSVRNAPADSHLRITRHLVLAADALRDDPEMLGQIRTATRRFLDELGAPDSERTRITYEFGKIEGGRTMQDARGDDYLNVLRALTIALTANVKDEKERKEEITRLLAEASGRYYDRKVAKAVEKKLKKFRKKKLTDAERRYFDRLLKAFGVATAADPSSLREKVNDPRSIREAFSGMYGSMGYDSAQGETWVTHTTIRLG